MVADPVKQYQKL